MKRSGIGHQMIFFAHSGGAQGCSGEGSFDLVSYLKKELSNENEIHYPIVDDPEAPTYKMWKKFLTKEFKKFKQATILVGHSLGASMLLKYLSEEKLQAKISALFLVSTPLWGSNGWDVEDFVLKENFELELIFINNVFLYHCKEDAIVPFKHLDFYKRAFPNSIVRVLEGKIMHSRMDFLC